MIEAVTVDLERDKDGRKWLVVRSAKLGHQVARRETQKEVIELIEHYGWQYSILSTDKHELTALRSHYANRSGASTGEPHRPGPRRAGRAAADPDSPVLPPT